MNTVLFLSETVKGSSLDSTVIAALIGLAGVVFTSFFGVFMLKLGAKNESSKAISLKKIEIFSELSGKLQSLQKSINIFTTLRLINVSNRPYSKKELEGHLQIFDQFVSEFYEYYKENLGKIKLLCSKKIPNRLDKLHEDIIACRDKYQYVIAGDYYGRTPEEYDEEWLKALYEADLDMRHSKCPSITTQIDEVIDLLSKDLKIRK